MWSTAVGSPSWTLTIALLLCSLQQVIAYRPVQHCKTIGDSGHYSACAALTQSYNTTTGHSDLFLRYHWFRYRNSKNGWHSFAMGQKMASAFMVLFYGDSNTPSVPMTIDIRTSEGHAPPRPIAEYSRFDGVTPDVEVVTAVFEPYQGDMKIASSGEKPTHIGRGEVIIRGFEKWAGAKPSNSSTKMDMIWASNYQQDMGGDFSLGRNIDMHSFGEGFGFLYVDMLNALTPEPMFGPINELGGAKGVKETQEPDPPTPEELAYGEKYIAQYRSGNLPAGGSSPDQAGDGSTAPVEQPARTILGKSLRDWMWHLHGLFMTLAFLALYPLGTYLIRSGKSTAFNNHWTIQCLASVALGIGSIIGWINSYSISVKHQYIGIAIVLAIAAQSVLGWRHHMYYLATKQKNWLSKSHIILGRIILPLGYVNIIMGMMLRQYGRFTIALTVIFITIEACALIFVLSQAGQNKGPINDRRTAHGIPQTNDEAEEYFQLDGADEFSDSEGEQDEERAAKELAKREQAEKLRRLDRV